MRQFLLILFLSSLAMPCPTLAEDERIPAAEVNGAPIYLDQIVRERRVRLGEIESEVDSRATNRVLIDRLIERELLLQQVTRLKLLPTKEEVLERMLKNKTAENDSAALGIRIKELGISEDEFLQRGRKDLAIERLLDREVYQGIQVSEDEIEREYQERKDSLTSVSEMRLRDIFIPVASEGGLQTTTAREEAARIRSGLSGEPGQFIECARKYSHGTGRESGGDLGYVTKNQLPLLYADTVFALVPGQLSDVILAEDGLHIFLVVDRRGGVTLKKEAVAEKLREELLVRKREEALRNYLETLRKTSKIIVYNQ